MQPIYDVVTADGTIVATGQVGGDPVAVPAGSYIVVVHSATEQRRPVDIAPGRPVQIQLP